MTPKRCCSSITARARSLVFDGVLEQGVGADDDLDGAVLDAAQQAGAFLALDRSGQQGDRDGAEAGQGAVVLLGQDLGGRHQGGLLAGFDRAQHGEQRDQGLAGADIALQQAQHAAGGGEVGVDFLQRLRPGTGWAESRSACMAMSRSRESPISGWPQRARTRPRITAWATCPASSSS